LSAAPLLLSAAFLVLYNTGSSPSSGNHWSPCCYCYPMATQAAVNLIAQISQISPIVINITLDGSNYPEWSFCAETALRGQGLYYHLTDNPPELRWQ
jgi:hypothetical protein